MSLQKEVLSLKNVGGFLAELLSLFFDEKALIVTLVLKKEDGPEMVKIFFDSPYSVRVCGDSKFVTTSREEDEIFKENKPVFITEGYVVLKFTDSYFLRKFNEESVGLYNENKECVHYRIVTAEPIIDIITTDWHEDPRIL